MKANSKIFVAGASGMLGAAVVRKLQLAGYTNILAPSHSEVDLVSQRETMEFFSEQYPGYVFLCAARVGGIVDNRDHPAEFIGTNLAIQANIIHSAWRTGVQKLLFVGSSCIYPRDCAQPIREEYLMSGPLESTNKAYAVAKIAGLEMCDAYSAQFGCNFFTAMPTNLYGPGDNFSLSTGHVLPAMLHRFLSAAHSGAKFVELWGDGSPLREFLFVDDCADALLYLMENYSGGGHINVGTGSELTIARLAEVCAEATGFKGEIRWDNSKPNGTPRKLLDCSKLRALGWGPRTWLTEGISKTIEYLRHEIARMD